jgi:hypothetical protein
MALRETKLLLSEVSVVSDVASGMGCDRRLDYITRITRIKPNGSTAVANIPGPG